MTDECGYRAWMGEVGRATGDAGERVEIPAVRSGLDEAMAINWAGVFMAAVTLSLLVAIDNRSVSWAFVALGAWVAAGLAAVGSRWRVRIDTDGLEFRRWICGLPVERKRFLLDVEVSRYGTWEQPDYDHGIEIHDPRGGFEDTTGCFGPYRSDSAQGELIAWLNAALQEALALSGERESAIRCARLDGKLDSIRLIKWGHNGEAREARTTRDLTFSGVLVPKGSTLLFNDDRPVRDPRREDTLQGARLSRRSVLPNGFELRRDALVSFVGERIWVHENGPGRVERDGVTFYVDDVMFDAEWQPKHFMLAESLVVDGFEIPAESDVYRMPALSWWSVWFSVTLAESVVHEGVRYGRNRSVTFDSGKRFMRPDSPRLCDATFDSEVQAAGGMEEERKEDGGK